MIKIHQFSGYYPVDTTHSRLQCFANKIRKGQQKLKESLSLSFSDESPGKKIPEGRSLQPADLSSKIQSKLSSLYPAKRRHNLSSETINRKRSMKRSVISKSVITVVVQLSNFQKMFNAKKPANFQCFDSELLSVFGVEYHQGLRDQNTLAQTVGQNCCECWALNLLN